MTFDSKKSSAWGAKETQFFFALTPEIVLQAVESAGIRCTGRALFLNSMENRVVELEIDPPAGSVMTSPRDRFRVAKFYRPGRWSREQILEEHQFLLELSAQEVPVITPIDLGDGETLRQVPGQNIFFAVFSKAGGRSNDEYSDQALEQLGRLIARMHNIGATHPALHRVHLEPETYGSQSLQILRELAVVPRELEASLFLLGEQIIKYTQPLFARQPKQRIHGDCHLGNILWDSAGPRLVDFDDMVMGPVVQDVWLVVPGRDEAAVRERDVFLNGYEQFRSFPYESLQLIEPLRALRYLHFAAWIGKRWSDPAFPKAFPHYAEPGFWHGLVADLREQVALIQGE